ncbi:restriction endonuclease subunit S [Mediterraneibacter massiliensis]|uniref:restriction endonuclease subunit S n=1 Tax=Mediterraneibacter massiliensis TaxID=1720300 RepID=UPI0024ACB961|nr:restriction endonuclease subunit S [Mediterraneibacter massiliensis]
MSSWKTCTIGDLGTVVGGATPSTKKAENYDCGTIAWITPKDLAGFSGRFISHGERNITEQGLKSCSTQMMPAHTVLFSSRAPIGYIAIANQEVCTNQGFKSVVPNEDTDYMFLYYLLKYNKDRIENLGSGTTFKEVSGSTMRGIEVLVPDSIEEQRQIASVLSTLDDKIEKNTEVNKNLFEQARALYKDRFIDLMPFGGSMPSDWHLGTVSEIIELHDSKRIPLSSRERAELDKIYPYYGATSVMDYVDRYLFDGIYLLLGEDGTVVDGQGFPILQYVEGKFWVNNHAHIITGKNGFTVELLYLLFSLTNVQSIVTGAVQPKISQANLNKVPIVIPSEAELKAFDESIQPFFAEIRNLRAENDRLATVRDSMLPRLMSGELDVSDLDF